MIGSWEAGLTAVQEVEAYCAGLLMDMWVMGHEPEHAKNN